MPTENPGKRPGLPLAEPAELSDPVLVPVVATQPVADLVPHPPHPHLVVVTTRAVRPGDAAPAAAVLVTRFWHPRDQRWSENYFETVEHALRLFLDESGWHLLQQQALAGEHTHELIFEARREDFTGPSTKEILQEVGLTPEDVADLLDRVEPDDTRPS